MRSSRLVDARKESTKVVYRVADDEVCRFFFALPELAGRTPSDAFDGKGACFVEMGDGVAAYATGDFYAEEALQVTLRRPGRHWHLAKVAFEKYWLRRWFR